MRKAILSIGLTVLVLGFTGISKADTVELNLFDLGCPTAFNRNSPYWQTDFDLDVTFSEISHVYIDWSGEITAGLAINNNDPCNPFPQEVGIYAGFSFPFRHAEVWGGEQTYPEPELFNSLSEITPRKWSDLLDGQGTIGLQYEEVMMLYGRYIEPGSVVLYDATLIVEGTVIPEPVTILLLSFGAGLMVRMRHSRTSR